MKNNYLVIAVLCTAALASCSKSEPVQEQSIFGEKLIHITITARMGDAKSDMSGTTWSWTSGDKLAVYDGIAKREFTLDESSASSSVAKFSGEVAENFTSLAAVFPFDLAADTFGTPAVPSEQTVESGKTADGSAMIATAEGEKVSENDYNFYFTSGVSFLRFTAPEGATRVVLHPVDEAGALAGDSRAVAVNIPSTGGQFWAAVTPAVYHGLRVFTRTASGDYMKSTTADIDLSSPGKAKNLGSLDGGTQVSVIETPAELSAYMSDLSYDAYVCADINMGGAEWTPVDFNAGKTFDGQYHNISNIVGLRKGNTIGFFATIKGASTLKDLNLGTSDGLNYDGTSVFNYAYNYNADTWIYIGGVAGTVEGTSVVSNVHNYATVKVTAGQVKTRVGGLFGKWSSTGTLKGSANHGEVFNNATSTYGSNQDHALAGCIGYVENTTNTLSCDNYGYVHSTLPNLRDFSGVIGDCYSAAHIYKCNNYADIKYESTGKMGTHCVGGIVSRDRNAGATIEDCHNYGTVTNLCESSGRIDVGGVLACTAVATTIKNCSNEADISNTADAAVGVTTSQNIHVAGIVARQDATAATITVSGCSNSGTLSNSGSTTNIITIGGINGHTDVDNVSKFENCVNKGKVNNSGSSKYIYMGGVIGTDNRLNHTYTNCRNYADVVNSGTASNSSYIGALAGFLGRGKVYSAKVCDAVKVNSVAYNSSWGDSSDNAEDDLIGWLSPRQLDNSNPAAVLEFTVVSHSASEE